MNRDNPVNNCRRPSVVGLNDANTDSNREAAAVAAAAAAAAASMKTVPAKWKIKKAVKKMQRVVKWQKVKR